MAFEGYVDSASITEISGWIFDNFAPEKPLQVEILDGDSVIANVTASNFRTDLQALGKGNGRHAFSFSAITPASHTLTARVAGRTWRIPPGGGYDIRELLPMRFEAELLHSLEYGLPVAVEQQGFSIPVRLGKHSKIADRLIAAYEKTIRDDPSPKQRRRDQWTEVESFQHREILSLLQNKNVFGLLLYLGDAHAKGITHGITQGEVTTKTLRGNAQARKLVMLQALDYVTSLSEYLGLFDVECPDQHGQWAENFQSDPIPLIERISDVTGISIVPPQVVGSAFGIRTDRGILSTRDILAFYAGLRIRAQLPGFDGTGKTGSVCEVGGGLGTAAYYCNRLGVRHYTIVDLPLISLLQGFFLLSALPDERIALYGEDSADASIRLFPSYAAESLEGTFDVVFNQDSFPEMHRDYATGYIELAKKKKVSSFLSINQEARAMQNPVDRQTVVRDLVKDVGDYQCKYRFRHWLRAGYVEELFTLIR